MDLSTYEASNEVQRGVARRHLLNLRDDVNTLLASMWTVEAFDALRDPDLLPGAARATMNTEENEDGTSSVELVTVYNEAGDRIWDVNDPDAVEIESTVTDYFAGADEYSAFDLTVDRQDGDGFSEASLADQRAIVTTGRVAAFAALNLRTHEPDTAQRIVLEVHGVTVDATKRDEVPQIEVYIDDESDVTATAVLGRNILGA